MTRLWISFGTVVAAALVCGYIYGRYPVTLPIAELRAKLLREEGIAPAKRADTADTAGA